MIFLTKKVILTFLNFPFLFYFTKIIFLSNRSNCFVQNGQLNFKILENQLVNNDFSEFIRLENILEKCKILFVFETNNNDNKKR